MRFGHWAALLLGLGVALPARSAMLPPADLPDVDREREFAIPAQPLDSALDTFARASGVDILYLKGLAVGRTSTALSGRYAEAAALDTLLSGTGLSSRFTGRNAAIVFTSATTPPPPAVLAGRPMLRLDMAQVRAALIIGTAIPPAEEAYAQRAAIEFRRLLSEDNAMRGVNFQILLALSITEDGRIESIAIKNGSGNPGRDKTILAILIGRTLPIPPPGLTRALQFEIDWSSHPAKAMPGRATQDYPKRAK